MAAVVALSLISDLYWSINVRPRGATLTVALPPKSEGKVNIKP